MSLSVSSLRHSQPKFTIDDQEPYTGGWCRPQTDGPALRAMAMAKGRERSKITFAIFFIR